MMFRHYRFVSILAYSLFPVSVASALESPQYQVTIESSNTIFTATPASSNVPGFKPHINFPYMKDRADGSLMVTYNVGQTHGSGTFGQRSFSYDGGLTWSHTTADVTAPASQYINPDGGLSWGVSMAFTQPAGANQWGNTYYKSFDGGTTWTFGGATFNSDVTYVNAYNNLDDMVIVNGDTFLMTAYAQRPGSSTLESVLFSTSNLTNWTRRSTIAQYVAGPNTSMGTEGANETGLVQLDNGNLLAVYRTGQPFPTTDINDPDPSLFWSISEDDGYTWTAPKMLGVAGVFPQLRKLDDGGIALTYGRYGAKVMFADPTGKRWTKPTVLYNGPSSGHTELRQRDDGKFVYVYDQSGFYPPSWDVSPPAGYVYDNNQSANLKALVLDIDRLDVHDDHPWALEYHGDVTPDTLAEPWALAQGGTTSTYLWADLGQDYIRLSTGANGTSRHLYYQLGSDSMWSRMDFEDGVVADFRARVGSESTSDSAAMLFMGDGENGFFSLELTGGQVGLEGNGGNAGQQNYTEAQNPGFSTSDWHDYRLIVAPDEDQNGSIVASLYLDGDYSEPILTQLLNLTANYDHISFGDLTGTNNGILDVDFLRFTRLNMLAGDTDFDGDVDLADLATLAAGYGTLNGANWAAGDFDWDGDIDLNDLASLASNYGLGQAQAYADFQALTGVPEPSVLLPLLGAVFMFRKRGDRCV